MRTATEYAMSAELARIRKLRMSAIKMTRRIQEKMSFEEQRGKAGIEFEVCKKIVIDGPILSGDDLLILKEVEHALRSKNLRVKREYSYRGLNTVLSLNIQWAEEEEE